MNSNVETKKPLQQITYTPAIITPQTNKLRVSLPVTTINGPANPQENLV